MIEEIIYTSAEKGLKAGSRGFCTVVSTAGMAINIAERLESMSGYRHAFPMQDPRARLNPVNYSHVTLRVGGKNSHVISRVADAGQDYSGRTNKLAHHLMIDDISRFAAGPARLMGEKGVLVSQWDGSVRTVPARNLPMVAVPGSIELTAWKAITGDSGWAGWVAEQLTKDKAPVSIIFSPGTDTLLLVREVLDLLPPIQQWTITFSTYFTKLLAGTECQLRFVLDETPEATTLRNDARARVVDLRALPLCSGGALVQQARSGRITAAKHSELSPNLSLTPARPVAEEEELAGTIRTASEIPTIPKVRVAGLPSIGINERQLPSLRSLNQNGAPARRTWSALYAVFGLLILIAAGTGLMLYFGQAAKQNATVANPTPSETGTPRDIKSELAAEPSDRNLAATDLPSNIEQAPANRSSENTSVPATDVTPMEKPLGSTASTAMPPVNSTDAAPPRQDVPKPEPLPEKIDPFQLAKDDKTFAYPNHRDLHLFPLPRNPGNEPSPSLPLVLQDDDTVHLAFHGSFHEVIDNPKGLEDVYDIQLSEPVIKENSSVWTARLLQSGMPVFTYGEYRLKAKLDGITTHVLEFVPGEMCRSAGATESQLSNLFRFCPLVITVHSSESTSPHQMIFCQRTGLSVKAEENKGARQLATGTSIEAGKDFRYLNFFAKDRQIDLELDVVTLATDGRRLLNRLPFTGRTASGDLYTTLALQSFDLIFHDKLASADGDAGHVKHSFNCILEADDNAKESAAQFRASKMTEAKFRLPWMSGKNEKPSKATGFEQLLEKATISYGEKDWASKFTVLGQLDCRLPVSTRREDVIEHNYRQLESSVEKVTSDLDARNTLLETTRKDEQAKNEKERNQATIDSSTNEMNEIAARRAAVQKLLADFSLEVHKQQFAQYLACLDSDAERLLGFEIAINLEDMTVDGVRHPKTTVYLIETSFPREQQ